LGWLDSAHHGPEAATLEAFPIQHPDAALVRQVEALQDTILG
jgi:hypothetical protein